MDIMTLYWLVFIAIFLIVYSIDLYVTEHRKETISIKSSLGWTAIWISVAMLAKFNLEVRISR